MDYIDNLDDSGYFDFCFFFGHLVINQGYVKFHIVI